jgi:ABC-type glycerol-3-phosphate transport system substrate-binding protein
MAASSSLIFGGAAALSGCVMPAAPGGDTAGSASPVAIKVLDAWGPGPWAEPLYEQWSAGLAETLPEISVEFIPTLTGEVSTQKTAALLAAGTPPDVTLGSDLRFALEGVVLDLQPFFDLDSEASSWEWNPPSWDFCNMVLNDGNPILWGMPGNSDARVIYVNLDLLDEAGIEYTPERPWSWDEFRANCQQLTKRRSDGSAEQLAFNGFGTWYGDLYVFANYAGGDFWDVDPNTDWVVNAKLDSPEVLSAITYFNTLLNEDRVGPNTAEQSQALQFLAGTVAMQPSWSSFFSSLNAAQGEGTLNFSYDLMPYPVVQEGDPWPNQFANGSQMGSILNATAHPNESFQVLRFLAGPDGHLIRQRTMGAPPSIMNIQSLWDEWLAPPPEHKDLYQQIMSTGKVGAWTKIKYDADRISTIYSNELDKLKVGEVSPEEFATTVTEQMNEVIEESYRREEG